MNRLKGWPFESLFFHEMLLCCCWSCFTFPCQFGEFFSNIAAHNIVDVPVKNIPIETIQEFTIKFSLLKFVF